MAIPKIDLPTYNLELKSTGQTIVFRPFIVKEEKILLMAVESGEFETVLQAIKQVIGNCLLTEVDIDALPLFEIEFIFLNIRARSMGEEVNLVYVCENVVENKKCKGEMPAKIDLLKVAVDMKVQNSTIKLTDKVGIKLRYPTINSTRILLESFTDIEVGIKIIKDCTEYLFDDDQIYKPDEMELGEFESFIENLTQDQYIMIKNFFDEVPTVSYDTTITCGKCGISHNIHLEGLQDFFE